MGDQSMGRGAGLMDEAVHQAFRFLAETDNNGTSNLNGANSTKFNPSMAIIIIVLISAFLFMGFFSIYVRRCTRADDANNANSSQQAARNAAAAANRPSQGLDRAVVEALPLVGYSLVKGLKGGKELSECAVCLSDFEEDEDLRLLPKCGHIFHPDCIDMWFHSHSTCPLCRASLVPVEGKEGMEPEGSTYTEDFQNWVSSRGIGPNGETFTIHDGPPVPPNGSILELLSRDGADRILAQSLRRTEPLDAGLARREGEDENAERAAGIRALNRALSRNSSSFRSAARGIDAGSRIDAANTGSARFNSSSVTINVNDSSDLSGTPRLVKKSRSIGSGRSFNISLLRSSSVGSSGRYLRQILGGQDDPDGFRSKLLGSEHKLPSVNPSMKRDRSVNELSTMKRDRSVNELSAFEMPVWEDVDLNAENGGAGSQQPTTNVPGVLPFERWANRGRKFFSGEVPVSPRAKTVNLSGELGGRLYTPRKDMEPEKEQPQAEERAKSERWNFGQSFRRTFSLKRTTSSTSSDVESLAQQNSSNSNSKPVQQPQGVQPGSSTASKPKKFTPWAGTTKIKRTSSFGGDGVPSPRSPSSVFPQSLPVDSFPQSLPVPNEQQQQQQSQQQQQQNQQQSSSTKDHHIQISTQP